MRPAPDVLRIGVDLGGTKIEAIAVDGNNTIRSRRRVATPRHDYAATLDAIAAPGRAGRGGGGRARLGGHRDPGRDLPRHRPGQERELDLAERTAPPPRPRSAPRPARAPGQRRQLLRPLRGHRRRGRRRARRVRRDRGDGHRAAASWSTAASSPAPTASAASGGTTRCPGRTPSETPGPRVLLQPPRVHRAVPLRARAEPRPPRADGRGPDAPRTSPPAPRPGDAACEEALRRYESRMARGLATDHQRRRSRRHRPRGRDVEPRAPLHARPGAMDGVGVLRPRGHAARAPAARPGERRARRGVAVVPGRGGGPAVRVGPRTRTGSRWSDTSPRPTARTPATSSPGTAR